jgi:hypothetical protein
MKVKRGVRTVFTPLASGASIVPASRPRQGQAACGGLHPWSTLTRTTLRPVAAPHFVEARGAKTVTFHSPSPQPNDITNMNTNSNDTNAADAQGNGKNPTKQTFHVMVPFQRPMSECFVIRGESLDEAREKARMLCPPRIKDWKTWCENLMAADTQPGNHAEAVCQPANAPMPAWFQVCLDIVQHFDVCVTEEAKNPKEARERATARRVEELLALEPRQWRFKFAPMVIESVELAGIEADMLRRQSDDDDGEEPFL